MKITKSQLRKIIKEEVSRVLLEEEESSFMDAYRKAMSKDDREERMKFLQMAYSIADSDHEVGDFLNQLKSDGLENYYKFFSREGDSDMIHHVSPQTFFGTADEKEAYNKELEKKRARLRSKGKIE